MNKWGKPIGFILLLSALAACGGGGGGSDPVPSGETGNNSDANANGIWLGTLTVNGSDSDLAGLFYKGELFFGSTFGFGELYEGSYSVSGNQITGDLNVYDENYGSRINTATFSGNVSEKSKITADYSSAASSGSFSLDYDALYGRNSSLNVITGIFSFSDGTGYTLTITIQNDGTFDGSDTNSCAYAGTVGIVDPAINVYDVELTITDMMNCPAPEGVYNGYAVLSDDISPNDSLIVFARRNGTATASLLTRQ